MPENSTKKPPMTPGPELKNRPWSLARFLPKAHWTPGYVVSRIGRAWYERRNPDAPWLSPGMISFLSDWLRPSDVVVEFGSGRSTIWFARRVARVVSCEHDAQWHGAVSERIRRQNLANVEYHLPQGELTPESYLAPVVALAPGSVDVVLIDGSFRDRCATWAVRGVRPGGAILIDNVNWYLPHATRSPASVGANGAPVSEEWARFVELTRGWRSFWVSDGITDTACWFAPPT